MTAPATTSAPAGPVLTPTSPTSTVAAWCLAHRLRASVVGRWVWVPYSQVHYCATPETRAELAALMRAAHFRSSKRRAAWYHDCGIPARKRVSGSLERYHRTISAGDYMGRGPSFAWYAKGRSSRPDADEVVS